MKWFINTFLVSLEERYIDRGKLWLTAKQVDVCRRYMEYGNLRGQMYLDVDNKHYGIQIAPNGCASFYVFQNGNRILTNPDK